MADGGWCWPILSVITVNMDFVLVEAWRKTDTFSLGLLCLWRVRLRKCRNEPMRCINFYLFKFYSYWLFYLDGSVYCMYWLCGCKTADERERQWEKRWLLKEKPIPRAIFSPLEQGAGPGSIPLSFFTVRVATPSAHHRRLQGNWTAAGDIYNRPDWWLCGTQTATLSSAC